MKRDFKTKTPMNKPTKFKLNPQNGIIVKLISLIESALTTFIKCPDYQTQYFNNPRAGEDTLTSALRSHLDLESRNIDTIFLFGSQEEQKESDSKKGKKRTVDIAIKSADSKGHYIFCLEAKWIDADDYITGDTGAIKRFKKCEHGLSSSNSSNFKPLDESGIVAYVKSGNFEDHFKKINKKIEDLSNQFSTQTDNFGLNWHSSEKLTQKYPNQSDKYISEHKRIDKTDLKLHHFWVNVATAEKQ